VYQDRKLVDFIEHESEAGFYPYLNDYGSGEVDVPVTALRKAVRMAAKLELSEETIKRLKEDIAAAKSSGDESVTYSCY
jgi:hypothetical protein